MTVLLAGLAATLAAYCALDAAATGDLRYAAAAIGLLALAGIAAAVRP